MRDERWVLLIFFDLPNTTKSESAEYRRFRKCLIDEAYLQLQESVYVRMFHNHANLSAELSRIRSCLPDHGNVSALPLHLNTFRKMITLLGSEFDFALLSDTILRL